jgi:hydroxymethylpyrimidine kinase/phosphomethylpyrimidine kinase
MSFGNVLTVAGSDSSGGAGIQADLKTFTALGVYGASVITSLTVQNTRGVVDRLDLEPRFVAAQIDAVLSDIDISCVKTGMLANAGIANAVGDAVKDCFVICDPVMISKNGYPLLDDEAVLALRDSVIRNADILTPNYRELVRLAEGRYEDPLEAGRAVMEEFGKLRALLVKGGHIDETGGQVTDTLLLRAADGIRICEFRHRRSWSENTHGTGCTLSSAITAYLARGNDIAASVEMAIDYVVSLIELSANEKIGKGKGPLPHHAGMKL